VQNFVEIGQTIPEICGLFYISQMATIYHFGFVISMFGQPTKSIQWSLELMQ